MALHRLKQDDEREEVITVVEQGLLHRLSDGLTCSEVDYPLDVGMLRKDSFDGLLIVAVHLVECRAYARDCLNALEHIDAGVGEIV